MPVYISILRGINVGGSRKIPMNELKTIYENLGFEQVISYIQSGNIIFATKNDLVETTLSSEIETAILNKWGFNVPVIIRTLSEVDEIVKGNPFFGEKEIDPERLYVTFLSDFPEKSLLQKIGREEYEPDRFIIIGKNIYLFCPDGYGRTKLSNTFFEKKLNVNSTTRNWKTIRNLFDLSLNLGKSLY